jgi:hypothetical protein
LERIQRGDYTLRGLVAEPGERGPKVDYHSVWTFVDEQDLSFKNVWPAPGLQAAHHWAREIAALGHEVRPISPQFVRPYVIRAFCV